MESTEKNAECMPKVEPQKEHQWLQKFVGEWTVEMEATMEPGKPSDKFTGTESVRSIGGLWTVAQGKGEMPGGESDMMTTIGYDPQKKRFVGTFVASMMTHLWLYEGTLDPDEKVLTLETEGPSMAGEGKMAPWRDVYEFLSDDHRTLTSYALGDDGEWHSFMIAHYRRKK